MRLGLPEILLIALLIVVFVNPRQLPGLFRKAGRLYQQIKATRETFVRGVNEIYHEGAPVGAGAPRPKGPGTRPTFVGDGPREGRAETSRVVLRTRGESLAVERRILKKFPAGSPTSVHLCTGTRMADRIVFQGIIRHAIVKAGPRGRIVAVAYEAGRDYSTRQYKPAPHETWIMQRPLSPVETDREIAASVAETAASTFPDVTATLYDHGGGGRDPEAGAAVIAAEMYSYYATTVAAEGIFPLFPFTAGAVADARAKLPRGPVVALHCRNRDNDPEKNPCRADMIALARELKRRSVALVLLPERESPDHELESLCDLTCTPEPTLQEPAGVLKLCRVFIGGDSGPAHLAAAVGTPVVSLRPPRIPWLNGPYCEGERLTAVQGTIVEHGGRVELSFDVDAALAATVAFLEAARAASGRAAPSEPVRKVEEKQPGPES